ncbi:MAG: FGGY family carbohydrate kinase [Candidatus Omnitrophica bacterium]|nr:FGGY family carbohydrate kinase [Candidatus Omnitrophota bacterium]
MRTFLGIDVGTSFIKGAVLDLEKLTLGPTRRLPFPHRIPDQPASFHEVDPREIVAATRQLIEQLLEQAPDCAGLVMSGQMGGLILGTARGKPLSNYISWQDKRVVLDHPSGGGSFFDVMRQRMSEEDWRHLGREVRPGLPVSFLFWMAENKQLPEGRVFAFNLPDWVLANLCDCPPATHFTQGVGALSLETLRWHEPVFAKLGYEQVRWPTLREITEPVGVLEINSQRLTCYPPVGDHQCSLAGAFIGFNELSLNVSTGSQASLLTPRWEPGNYQTRPFFDGRFLNTITHLPAGRSMNLLVDLLTELAAAQKLQIKNPWPYIAEEVEKAGETDLGINLAFYPGPMGDHGAITNIRETNLTVGNLFRAAFANMADSYLAAALRLSPKRAWRNLLFSGGLALQSEFLRNLISKKLESEYRMCSSTEDALQGLLALALVIGSRAASVEQAIRILKDNEKSIPVKKDTP